MRLRAWREAKRAARAKRLEIAGPGGKLQPLYELLVEEIKELTAAGTMIERISYGANLSPIEMFLEQHVTPISTMQNPYQYLVVDEDEVLYSYETTDSGYGYRSHYWQAGLTPEQLEMYQTFRSDGMPAQAAVETARTLTP